MTIRDALELLVDAVDRMEIETLDAPTIEAVKAARDTLTSSNATSTLGSTLTSLPEVPRFVEVEIETVSQVGAVLSANTEKAFLIVSRIESISQSRGKTCIWLRGSLFFETKESAVDLLKRIDADVVPFVPSKTPNLTSARWDLHVDGDNILMTDVVSTNASAIGYDESSRKLYVQFKSAGVYLYEDVDPDVYERLCAAPSIGQFLNQVVKPAYPFRKL